MCCFLVELCEVLVLGLRFDDYFLFYCRIRMSMLFGARAKSARHSKTKIKRRAFLVP